MIAGAILAAVAVAILFLMLRKSGGPAAVAPGVVQREWEPLGREVTVEVLNGGGSPGAALDAVRLLRRARLDVVQWGNAPQVYRDTTRSDHRILVRRGDTTGAGRVIEALGPAEVIDSPDHTRLVDLTVIVGRRAQRDSI